jgi:hypothetical protein
VIQNKKYKNRTKSAKFGFLLVAWPRGELRWAFMLIVLWCFYLCDLLYLSCSHPFVYLVLGFEHLLDQQQFLLWTIIQLSFTALKFAYISHHILPSKLHLLLSSIGLPCSHPTLSWLPSRQPVATCSISRTLIERVRRLRECVIPPTFGSFLLMVAICYYILLFH